MSRDDANNLNIGNIIIGAGELEVDGVNVGFTREGVKFSYERTILEVEVDQDTSPVKHKRTASAMIVSTNLLEATLNNIKIVWGISGTTTSLGDGTTELKFGSESSCEGETEHELWFSGPGPDCKTRYVEIYKAYSMEAGEHTYTKAGEVVIPVVFKVLSDRTKPVGERFGRILDTEDDWID